MPKIILLLTFDAITKLNNIPEFFYPSFLKVKNKNVKILVMVNNDERNLPSGIKTGIKNNIIEAIHVTSIKQANALIKSSYTNIPVITINDQKLFSKNVFDLPYTIPNDKRKILCADVQDEENNGFALFKYLFENYKDQVETRYLTNNKKILNAYPDNAFSWKHKNGLIAWSDTICYSYENFSNVSKNAKEKIFLQHGITWANSDDYIRHILNNSTYATCTVQRELDYFKSLHTTCSCYLTGMPIYDYDKANATNGKNIVIMFTYRSNADMPWIQSFVDSPKLKLIHDLYGYNIYYVKHHHPNAMNKSVKLPDYITSKPISELGNLVRKSDILITDYSSISFKAAYLNKSVYYYQPDYDEYCKDPIKSKGWFNWKTECLGFRSETANIIFNKIIDEINGKFNNKINSGFFTFNDDNNAKRICKKVLKL